MKPETALRFFKTRRAMARAADCSTQYVYRWNKAGLIPERYAIRLSNASGGKLKVNPRLYKNQENRPT